MKTTKFSAFLMLAIVSLSLVGTMSIFSTATSGDGEPNGSFATATQITFGNYTDFAIDSGYEYDYYNISLTANDNVFVGIYELTWDVDLYFYNTTQGLMASSARSDIVDDNITVNIPISGNYTIKLSGFSLTTDYVLTILNVSGDAYEENDEFSTAKLVTPGTYTNLTLYDDDFYKVALTAGYTVSVNCTRITTSNTNYNYMYIYNTNQVQIDYDLDTIKCSVTFTATDSGNYYIKMLASNNVMGLNYTLWIGTPVATFEPNNNIDAAIEIKKGQVLPTMTLVEGLFGSELDFFKVKLNAGENISIVMRPLTGDSYFSVSLYYYNFTVIETDSTTSSSAAGIDFIAPADDYYYICVSSLTATGDYTLSIDDIAPSAGIDGFPMTIIAIMGILGIVSILSKSMRKRVN